MKQNGLLIISIIVFSLLFYILNNNNNYEQNIAPQIETFTSENLDINPQADAVDVTYLNTKTTQLVKLKNDLLEIRNALYNKKLTDFLIVKPKYKDLDDANPQQFDVEIAKQDNFSNIMNINVPIGIKGEQGLVGNKGSQGQRGQTGEKGPVGHCGAIIS